MVLARSKDKFGTLDLLLVGGTAFVILFVLTFQPPQIQRAITKIKTSINYSLKGFQSGNHTLPDKLEPQFIQEVEKLAKELKTKPEWLLAVMGFESAGSYEPWKRNFIGATGLIQFIPSTARGLGTSTDDLARMSRLEQLRWVRKYYKPFKGKLNSLEDAYAAVLTGRVGWGRRAVWSIGSIEYRQNRGLDLNRDGQITMQEAATKVRKYLPTLASYQQQRG